MNHIGTQTIETRRLVLRRFTVADAQAMFDNWANDPEVTKIFDLAAPRQCGSDKEITGMLGIGLRKI